MATISKFYFHDAATPNTGTMPGTGTAFNTALGTGDGTGDATGARTARAADGTIGALEKNIVNTATANTSAQNWGLRRFVSAPLAAHTFSVGDGNWTFSFAAAESNTNHNGLIICVISAWRPSTGATVTPTGAGGVSVILPTTTKTAVSGTGIWNGVPVTILDGDILVFEIGDSFTQGMSVAYTSTFYYDGTTEASTSSCASFITPPSALTLFVAGGSPSPPARPFDPIPFLA